MGRLHPMFQPRTLLVCERKFTPYLSLERGSLVTVADPGEGPGRPPPNFYTKLKKKKKFWGVTGPPLSKGLDDPPPPPSISRSGSGTVSYLVKKIIAILDHIASEVFSITDRILHLFTLPQRMSQKHIGYVTIHFQDRRGAVL